MTMPDMSLPDLDSSLASVRRRAGWGAEGTINNSHCVFFVPQIQELLSPQEPPKPIEAENSNPDSGELSNSVPPLTLTSNLPIPTILTHAYREAAGTLHGSTPVPVGP